MRSTEGPARGLLKRVRDYGELAEAREWMKDAASPVRLDWPPAERSTILAWWRSERVSVALVEDHIIARSYFWCTGPGASDEMDRLVRLDAVHMPSELLAAARAADSWAAAGESLYDLVAGAIDPSDPDVLDIWQKRTKDRHPLVRLAAAWVAPYLTGVKVIEALDTAANADEEKQVREAAAESLAIVTMRVHG